MKDVGEPDEGEPHVRFDVREPRRDRYGSRTWQPWEIEGLEPGDSYGWLARQLPTQPSSVERGAGQDPPGTTGRRATHWSTLVDGEAPTAVGRQSSAARTTSNVFNWATVGQVLVAEHRETQAKILLCHPSPLTPR